MTQLVRYEAARYALEQAATFDEVTSIRDEAERAALWARQARDTELIERATEIKVRAERKAGEMLRAAKSAGQLRGVGNPQLSEASTIGLDTVGITRDQSSRYQKLAAMPEEQFEAAVQTAKAVAGQVTTAFMLKQATPPRQELAPEEVEALPIDILPDRRITELSAANKLIDAVEALASLPFDADRLRSALPQYQHYRITNHIDAAIAALHKVRKSWTSTTEA